MPILENSQNIRLYCVRPGWEQVQARVAVHFLDAKAHPMADLVEAIRKATGMNDWSLTPRALPRDPQPRNYDDHVAPRETVV